MSFLRENKNSLRVFFFSNKIINLYYITTHKIQLSVQFLEALISYTVFTATKILNFVNFSDKNSHSDAIARAEDAVAPCETFTEK